MSSFWSVEPGHFCDEPVRWIDLKLFPADVRYQATVEQLEHALYRPLQHRRRCRVVEQAVGRSVDCARVPATDRGAGVDGRQRLEEPGRFRRRWRR